jgi:2-keto-3-deoxy-L-rhamnonate aldolase RhmA
MSVVTVNVARQRLENDQVSLGVGLRLARTVDIAKAMRTAGFDWLFIDLEHGSIPLDVAANISVAALDSGITPIVRVPHAEYGMATRALDTGALGIVMPHVDTAEEAREVVDRLRFPPLGHRSVGYAYAPLDFRAVPTSEAAPQLNAATLLTVMLETPEAIANADAIAAVPGVDVVMIGTNDLCAELGIPSQFTHAKIVDAYEKVIAAAKKHGKWVGSGGVPTEEGMAQYVRMGVRFLLSGADFAFMMAAGTARAKALRALDQPGR